MHVKYCGIDCQIHGGEVMKVFELMTTLRGVSLCRGRSEEKDKFLLKNYLDLLGEVEKILQKYNLELRVGLREQEEPRYYNVYGISGLWNMPDKRAQRDRVVFIEFKGY